MDGSYYMGTNYYKDTSCYNLSTEILKRGHDFSVFQTVCNFRQTEMLNRRWSCWRGQTRREWFSMNWVSLSGGIYIISHFDHWRGERSNQLTTIDYWSAESFSGPTSVKSAMDWNPTITLYHESVHCITNTTKMEASMMIYLTYRSNCKRSMGIVEGPPKFSGTMQNNRTSCQTQSWKLLVTVQTCWGLPNQCVHYRGRGL